MDINKALKGNIFLLKASILCHLPKLIIFDGDLTLIRQREETSTLFSVVQNFKYKLYFYLHWNYSKYIVTHTIVIKCEEKW